MSSTGANFAVKFDTSSSDDESLFITQESSQAPILDVSVSDIELEGLMETSKDSAIGVENVEVSSKTTFGQDESFKYEPEIENITDSEDG